MRQMRTAGFPIVPSSLRLPFALLGVCGGLLFAGAGEAHGAWPGRDGPVVFVGYSYAGEDGEESASEGLRRVQIGRFETPVALTVDPNDRSPRVSPDGRWVVFTRSSPSSENGEGQRSIYIVDVDGGSLRRVSNPPPNAEDADPIFDASGTRIFFARRQGAGQHIYEMPVAGGPARRLTRGRNVYDAKPAVSPRGRQIVFQRTRIVNSKTNQEIPTRIYSMRPNGSHLVDLTAAVGPQLYAGQPDFSPDGKSIAFALSGQRTTIFVMRADGSHLRRVMRPRESYTVNYSEPCFSPTGEWIAMRVTAGYRSVLGRVKSGGRDNNVGDFGRLRGRSPAWGPQFAA
jgi:Tol biopolymer transport system component